jgi:hypothetical protein
MAIDIKALFGDKESLTLDELEAALKGMNLVDLNGGEYVSKAKFEDRQKKLADQVADLESKLADKPSGDEGEALTKKLEALTTELETVKGAQTAAEQKAVRLEHEALVAKHVKSPKLARVALMDAEERMDDDTSFEAALDAVLKDDPDYAEKAEDEARFKSGTGVQGAPSLSNTLKDAVDSVFDGPKKE